MTFSDFSPSNIVKLENFGPTFSSFTPLLSYSSVATTAIKKLSWPVRCTLARLGNY